MTQNPGEPGPFALLRRSSAAVAATLGLLALAGWLFHVEVLKSGLAGRATMKPNTALSLVLGAVALLLYDSAVPLARRLGRVSAAAVAAVGLLTLAEYAFGAGFGIDQLLFSDEATRTTPPGRMAPGTALCCATLGLAQSLAMARRARAAQVFALVVLAVSGLALLGYLYNVEQLYQVAAYASMSLPTATAFTLLGLATLFLHPARGLLAGLTSASPVGQFGRRLLLMALVAPTLLGWLGVQAQRRSLYGAEFGVAVLVGATLAVMAAGIWLGVRAGVRLDEERLRLARIVETTADAIITTRLDGTITSWNAAAERLYGFSAGEAMGASMDMLVPLERRMEVRDGLQRLLAGEELKPHDTVRLRKDGTPVDVHLTLSAVRSHWGAIMGASAIARDVSERTRSQRALLDASRFNEQIVRSSAEGIIVLDRDLRYVLWSPSLEAMTGLRAEEVLGRHPLDLFPYLSESEAVRGLHRALHGEVVTLSDVEAIHPKTQAPLWVSTHSTPLRSADGEIVGVLVTVTDITERRQAEAAQRALARRVLTAQEDERRRVARELHDQVGQILTSIKIQLAGVARVKAIEEVKPRVQAATEQVDMAIGQVRDLSRGLRPPQLDDLGLVPTLRWYAGQRSAESGVDIGLESRLPDLRLGPDEEMACFRVAQEAITNALRHARPSRVVIELESSREALALSVRDDGVGFDFPSVGRRAAAGECLGLTSMRERVSLCGGSLEVRSAPGQGTLVRALIPLVRKGPGPAGAPA